MTLDANPFRKSLTSLTPLYALTYETLKEQHRIRLGRLLVGRGDNEVIAVVVFRKQPIDVRGLKTTHVGDV